MASCWWNELVSSGQRLLNGRFVLRITFVLTLTQRSKQLWKPKGIKTSWTGFWRLKFFFFSWFQIRKCTVSKWMRLFKCERNKWGLTKFMLKLSTWEPIKTMHALSIPMTSRQIVQTLDSEMAHRKEKQNKKPMNYEFAWNLHSVHLLWFLKVNVEINQRFRSVFVEGHLLLGCPSEGLNSMSISFARLSAEIQYNDRIVKFISLKNFIVNRFENNLICMHDRAHWMKCGERTCAISWPSVVLTFQKRNGLECGWRDLWYLAHKLHADIEPNNSKILLNE